MIRITSISCFTLFVLLICFFSCKKNDPNNLTPASSISDSLIKKIEHFINGELNYTQTFTYNEKCRLAEYAMNGYKNSYRYYKHDSIVVVNRFMGSTSAYTDSFFFEGDRLIQNVRTEDGWNCEVYKFFYNENGVLIRQSYLSKDKSFYIFDYLTYEWENGNNVSYSYKGGSQYHNTFNL